MSGQLTGQCWTLNEVPANDNTTMKDPTGQSRNDVPAKDKTQMKDPKGQSRNEVPAKDNKTKDLKRFRKYLQRTTQRRTRRDDPGMKYLQRTTQ